MNQKQERRKEENAGCNCGLQDFYIAIIGERPQEAHVKNGKNRNKMPENL